MMLPFPLAIMAGPNSWQGRKTPPTRFMSKLSRQSSRAMASKGSSAVTVAPGVFPPAALTSTVTAPNLPRTAWWATRRLAGLVASQSAKKASPPAASMASTRCRPRFSLRPNTATLAPAAASPSAMAPPRAPVAPITAATSSLRSNKFISTHPFSFQ